MKLTKEQFRTNTEQRDRTEEIIKEYAARDQEKQDQNDTIIGNLREQNEYKDNQITEYKITEVKNESLYKICQEKVEELLTTCPAEGPDGIPMIEGGTANSQPTLPSPVRRPSNRLEEYQKAKELEPPIPNNLFKPSNEVYFNDEINDIKWYI